ncbi:hypothetical protein B0H34DRAFT_678719 [Crassisporium funariophilum]|nr:hypothetical protein B0H34DRAFT_678719 [Crassisporium funariophilum]
MPDLKIFQILKITAYSDHPVRNSVGKLIFGHHVLWEGDNLGQDDKGSLAPNIFSYDFISPLASKASLQITIKAIHSGHVGGEYRLCGALDATRIIESDLFTVGSKGEITMAAHVIEPVRSAVPFSWNAEVSWSLGHKGTGRKIDCAYPRTTQLELYFISDDIHEIFLAGRSGVPVELLRNEFPSLFHDRGLVPDTSKSQTGAVVVDPARNKEATQQAYGNYSKKYDTTFGKSHFGMSNIGGKFNYGYYIEAGPNGQAGSLHAIVNCYDQAAMVQVLGRFGTAKPSWLFQRPYGYITATQLVGIPSLCNNPFFSSNQSPQNIGINDLRRTAFGNHVFNGLLSQFDPKNDRIYDACAGPHLGTEAPLAYLAVAIDKVTDLYQVDGTEPGAVSNITQHRGVTTLLRASDSTMTGTSPAGSNLGLESLIEKAAVDNPKPLSQVHWHDVTQWVKSVLKERCNIAFQEIDIGSRAVEALWHLTGVDGVDGDELVVRVRVETCIGNDQKLDIRRSSSAALDHLRFQLKNTQPPFGDFAQYSLQYATGLPQGRILLVSGNHMIEFSGGSSSSALEPVVRVLLTHTTVDKPFSLDIPQITHHHFEIPEGSRGHASNIVKGIGSTFTVECQLDQVIAAGTTEVNDFGLLLSECTIRSNTANATSAVSFAFVTRKLGTHTVDLHFATAMALTSNSKRVQVTVVHA